MARYYHSLVLLLVDAPLGEKEQIISLVSEMMQPFEQINNRGSNQSCSCMSHQASMVGRFVARMLAPRKRLIEEVSSSLHFIYLQQRLAELKAKENRCPLSLSKDEWEKMDALNEEMTALLARSQEKHRQIEAEATARASEQVTPDPDCELCRGTGLTSFTYNKYGRFDGWTIDDAYPIQPANELDGSLIPDAIITVDRSWLSFDDHVESGALENCKNCRARKTQEVLEKHTHATAVVVTCWWIDQIDLIFAQHLDLCERLLPVGLNLYVAMGGEPKDLDACAFSEVVSARES
jgi:hypothetical protein